MTGTWSKRLGCAVALAWLALVGSATPSVAAQSAPDFAFELPAGEACPGFGLRLEGWNSPHQVVKEFSDKNGNVVRRLTAGRGSTLALTNVANGETLSLRPNGAVERVTPNPDGSETHVALGHNVLILFPTDVPAGPSTTLYVGRFVYTVDPNFVFTLQSASGTSTDICAALTQ